MLPLAFLPRAVAAPAAAPSGHVDIKDGPSVDLEFPPMRTNTDFTQTFKGPCSGSSLGERVDYPLTGGKVFLSQRKDVDLITMLYTGDVSKGEHEFTTYGEETVVDAGRGHVCADGPDFKAAGFKAGDPATIMVMYQADGAPRKGTDKRWQYLCADVNLIDNWQAPEDFVCVTAGEQKLASVEDSMNVTLSSDNSKNGRKSAAVATNSDSGLSPAEAGGIGAGVTVGAFLLLAGLLFALGYRLKKKNKGRIIMDDSSSTSSYPRKDPQMAHA